MRVRLRKAEECDVESTAVVEVELVGLVDDCLRIDRGAEVEAAGRHTADHARLRGQRDQVAYVFFSGDRRDALRHADAEIDDAVRPQLERGAARDDLAHAHRERLDVTDRHPQFAGVGGVVGGREGLRVVCARRDHDAVHQHAGNLHLARIQGAPVGDPFDLHDDQPAAVACGHRDRQAFQRERFALHRDVAVGIGGGAADDRDVDRQRFVEQVFTPVERHQRHQVFDSALVELAATMARVDERAQADTRQVAGFAGGDIAVKMGDHTLRQVVGVDLAGHCKLLQPRHQSPVAADRTPDQAGVRQVIQAACLAIALPGRI